MIPAPYLKLMRVNQNAVILFTGDPIREASQKHLPPRFLSSLHEELVRTVGRCEGIDLIVASESREGFRIEGPGSDSTALCSSLGEKIDRAFRSAFDTGYRSVILLAGDIVGLDAGNLTRAFADLGTSHPRAVLGPSPDGGFYLLGLNALAEIRWKSVPWFTESAASTLVETLRLSGFDLSFLGSVRDVDSYADAVRAVRDLRFGSFQRRLLSLLSIQVPATRRNLPDSSPFARASLHLRAPPTPLA